MKLFFSSKKKTNNNNIKCVDSTIRCISFESIHYIIKVSVVQSFMDLSDLILCFYGCIVGLNQ